MINIKIFASLRERLQEDELTLPFENEISIEDFVLSLGQLKGDLWLATLTKGEVLTAVNQTIVDRTHLLKDGDELAFFPPVTGG